MRHLSRPTAAGTKGYGRSANDAAIIVCDKDGNVMASTDDCGPHDGPEVLRRLVLCWPPRKVMLQVLVLISALPIWFFAGLLLSSFLSEQMGVSEKPARIIGWIAPLLIFFAWVFSGR